MTKSNYFTVELTVDGDIVPSTLIGFSFRGKAVEAAKKTVSAAIGKRILVLDAKETLWAEPIVCSDLPEVGAPE